METTNKVRKSQHLTIASTAILEAELLLILLQRAHCIAL